MLSFFRSFPASSGPSGFHAKTKFICTVNNQHPASLATLWGQIIESVQPHVSRRSYTAYLKPSKLIAHRDGEMVVETSDEAVSRRLASRYYNELCQAARETLGSNVKITFTPHQQDAAPATTAPKPRSKQFNRNYTFDTIVKATFNHEAITVLRRQFAAARARAAEQDPTTNLHFGKLPEPR